MEGLDSVNARDQVDLESGADQADLHGIRDISMGAGHRSQIIGGTYVVGFNGSLTSAHVTHNTPTEYPPRVETNMLNSERLKTETRSSSESAESESSESSTYVEAICG